LHLTVYQPESLCRVGELIYNLYKTTILTSLAGKSAGKSGKSAMAPGPIKGAKESYMWIRVTR
jgi:hypothetical protein